MNDIWVRFEFKKKYEGKNFSKPSSTTMITKKRGKKFHFFAAQSSQFEWKSNLILTCYLKAFVRDLLAGYKAAESVGSSWECQDPANSSILNSHFARVCRRRLIFLNWEHGDGFRQLVYLIGETLSFDVARFAGITRQKTRVCECEWWINLLLFGLTEWSFLEGGKLTEVRWL